MTTVRSESLHGLTNQWVLHATLRSRPYAKERLWKQLGKTNLEHRSNCQEKRPHPAGRAKKEPEFETSTIEDHAVAIGTVGGDSERQLSGADVRSQSASLSVSEFQRSSAVATPTCLSAPP